MRGKEHCRRRLSCLPVISVLFIMLYGADPVIAQKNPLELSSEFPSNLLIRDTIAITRQIRMASGLVESYPDSALILVNHALKSALALSYKDGIIQGFFELGLLYHLKGDHQKSILVLQAALPYCDNSKAGRTRAVKFYTGIAYRYSFMDKNDSSAIYYYKALDDIERWKIDNPDVLINTYYKMVLLWVNMTYRSQELPEADKYLRIALTYLNKAEQLEKRNSKMLSKIILSKAHINYMQRHLDLARQGYYQYLKLEKQGSMDLQESTINSTYINIAATFLLENKADSALYYTSLVLARLEKAEKKDSLHLISAMYYSGSAFFIQKKYRNAIQITLPALKMAEQLPPSVRIKGHEILSQAYGAMGDYQAAWQHLQAYSLIRDSIKSQESLRSVNQMEVKYKVAERDKQLAEKEMAIIKRDNSIKTKNIWIGGIFAGLLLVILISLLVYRMNRQKQRIGLLKLQQEKEVALLHAMIEGEEKERNRLAGELHDGIGGLLGTIRMQLGSALKTYLPESGAEIFKEILLLLDDAYGELRKTAHNLMPEILQQEGLEVATAIFCDRVRTDNLDITYETVGSIPRMKPGLELAIYRIIQELLHNIIKHAFATEAIVQLAFIDNRLGITVEDNGRGMATVAGNSTGGMGIKTIQNRIRSMGGKFDISSSEATGTSINLEFNITAKEREPAF